MEANGATIPIGLVDTAIGGSMIEEWVTDDVAAECKLADHQDHNAILYDNNVRPYLDMTVKGFLWYQGENNCGTLHGNSAYSAGYGCLMPALVKQWRRDWSKNSDTHPKAPFGIVSLSSNDCEGSPDIASFRWSQSANYGTVPNPALENCFLAHGYDLRDPWAGADGSGVKCNASTYDKNYDCKQPWFMGPEIHPRLKKPVGARLAFAAHSLVYSSGSLSPVTGPTISGCKLSEGTLRIFFNKTLLRNSKLHVQSYKSTENSAFSVAAPNGTWYAANISLSSHSTIDVDVSFLRADRPHFIRYAWGETGGNAVGGDVDCCNQGIRGECIPGRCPIVALTNGAIFGSLPANPFLAKITKKGKCLCPAPQLCDA